MTHKALFLIAVSMLVTGSLDGVGAEAQGAYSEMLLEIPKSRREIMTWLESNTAVAQAVHGAIEEKLKEAEVEHETLKVTCLKDKLTQVSTGLEGIRARTQSYRTAVRTSDIDNANRDLSTLKTYFSRISSLKDEANGCVGEKDVVLGKTSVETVLGKGVTRRDPSSEANRVVVTVDPPEHVSGFF